MNRPVALAALSVILLGPVGSAQSLTIFRIGDANRPPPQEVERGEAEFRQLSWADLHEAQGGRSENLLIGADSIRPLRFGSEQNIAPLVDSLGGLMMTQVWTNWSPTVETLRVNDGDPESAYISLVASESGEQNVGDYLIFGKTFLFDLGGEFAVDRVRFYTRAGHEDRIVDNFLVLTNRIEASKLGIDRFELARNPELVPYDFQRDLLRESDWLFNIVADVRENQRSLVEVALPKEPIRRIAVWVEPQRTSWEIAELEIFASGYALRASYVSNIIDLEAFAALGWVRWVGRRDSDAGVSIRSQSGDDADPNVYWRHTFQGDERVSYDVDGRTLDRRRYFNLELSQRAGSTRDSDNWELWTAPYDFGDSLGVPLITSKPRRFVQFQVDFESKPQEGAELAYLEFAVSSPPSASDLVAEVKPGRVVASEETDFIFTLQPTLAVEDRGFDGIEIRSPGGRIIAVKDVLIGGALTAFETVEVSPQRLAIQVPRLDLDRTGELIEIAFRGEIFRYGATFSSRVFDSEAPLEAWQTVRSGDASPLVDSNSLSVRTASLTGSVLDNLSLDPPVFTPNGDGVNDRVDISYEMLKVSVSAPVTIRVLDLGGRLVHEVYSGHDDAGRHVHAWDGRDLTRRPVAPGLYLCQVETDTEKGSHRRIIPLAVSY